MCIPPVPDQDLHVTFSEARIRKDGHQARIVRSQQLTNQTVNIPQHKELGQILVGGLRLKVYPHQTNLKILQAIQPPRRHLAPSPPRMRRRQLRANLRYRTTLSRLQLSTPRWPNHAETHAFPTRRLFQVSDALPLPSGTQGLPCTTHEETSECFPLES